MRWDCGASTRRLPLVLLVCGLLLAAAPAAWAKPTAAVALGDSAISGESAGSYEPGTDQRGNYCHRSQVALIHKTAIPGIDATLNLSCSGAKSANLYIDGASQNGEPPQSAKLRQAARDYDIKLIIVEVGANDDPSFADVATECVLQFLLIVGPGCRNTVGPSWLDRLAGMTPKVERALDDTRTVMRQEGYADSSYQVIQASYWSPAPRPPIRYLLHPTKLLNGCPILNADMEWAHDTAVPQLNTAIRGIAERKGWRFLDLSLSMDGREICARGITHDQEWITGLKYDPNSDNWYTSDSVRQSFHANARGHAQLGRCLTEFAAQSQREARCLRGTDGNLHAVP
jgi:hypothetical protein